MTDNRNAIDTALIKLSTACHYLELTRPSKKDVKCASEAAKDASDILKASLVLLDHDCYSVQDPPQAAGTPLFDPEGQPTPAAAQSNREPEPATERGPVGELGCGIIDVETVDLEAEGRTFLVGDIVAISEDAAGIPDLIGIIIEDDGDEEECSPYEVLDKENGRTFYNAGELTLVERTEDGPGKASILNEEPPKGSASDKKKVFAERLATLENIFADLHSDASTGDNLKAFRPHRDAWMAKWKADSHEAWYGVLRAIANANTDNDFTSWAPAA